MLISLWGNPVGYISEQISKVVGILSKTEAHATPKNYDIYLILVLPHLSYCSSIWSGTTKTNLNKVCTAFKGEPLGISPVCYHAVAPINLSSSNFTLEDLISLNVATFTL